MIKDGNALRKYSASSGSWARHWSAEFMKQVLPMFPRPSVPGSSDLLAEEEEEAFERPKGPKNGEVVVLGDEADRWLPILAKKPSLEGKRGALGVRVMAVSRGGSGVAVSTSQPSVDLNSTTKASPC